jgi:hypothetical protein
MTYTDTIYPFEKRYKVTSNFLGHMQRNPRAYYLGVDYNSIDPAERENRPVYAPEKGRLYGMIDSNGGKYAILKSSRFNLTWMFLHLNSVNVPNGTGVNGREVEMGEQIGTTGNTGWSTGAHTHVSIITNTNWRHVNEVPYLFHTEGVDVQGLIREVKDEAGNVTERHFDELPLKGEARPMNDYIEVGKVTEISYTDIKAIQEPLQLENGVLSIKNT